MTGELRPVYHDPGTVIPEYYDEDTGEPRDHGVGWDLSFDCRVSFGYVDGDLHASVCSSGADRRNGITARSATPEQLRAFAAQLVALAGLSEPPAVVDSNAEWDRMVVILKAMDDLITTARKERDAEAARADVAEEALERTRAQVAFLEGSRDRARSRFRESDRDLAEAMTELATLRAKNKTDRDCSGCPDSCRCQSEPLDLELCGDSERLLHVTDHAAEDGYDG